MTPYLIIALVGCAMIAVEQRVPRRQAESHYWYVRALTFNAAQAAITGLGVITWDLLLPQPLWSGPQSIVLEVVCGYLLITFIYYWWHRARHSNALLWRCLHQLHHSPVRLEVLTSFYKHPLEILLNGLLSAFILTSVIGVSPLAATLTVAITAYAEFFYHWNVATPHWVGYFIQRPEMHAVHHQRDHHNQNFSDLPLWDALFGTYSNPRTAPEDCGFSGEAELRITDLLLGRDPGRESTRQVSAEEQS